MPLNKETKPNQFLLSVKRFRVLLFNTNISINDHSFAYTQLNDKTVLCQAIQFSVSHLFTFTWNVRLHSLNVKQFYFTHRLEPVRCYHSGTKWTWQWWQWKGTLHSSKLLHYWRLTIWLFSDITRKLVGGESDPCAEMQSVYSTAPADWAISGLRFVSISK